MRTKSPGGSARKFFANGSVKGRKPASRPRNPMVAALVGRKASSAGGRHSQSKSALRIALSKDWLELAAAQRTAWATAVELSDHDEIQ
jgi:hypothetical protein